MFSGKGDSGGINVTYAPNSNADDEKEVRGKKNPFGIEVTISLSLKWATLLVTIWKREHGITVPQYTS